MKESHKDKKIKKYLSVIAGVLVALLFSAPYIVFREQMQHMHVIGYISLGVACAISNVSIFLPSSSTLIVVVAASTLNPVLCVLCGGIGTCIGEQSSYICGRVSAVGVSDDLKRNQRVVQWLKKREFLTIFAFAFIPLPIFDIVGIAAGAMRIKWIKYSIAAVLGKTLKFLFAVVGIYYIIPCLKSSILQQILEQFGIVY